MTLYTVEVLTTQTKIFARRPEIFGSSARKIKFITFLQLNICPQKLSSGHMDYGFDRQAGKILPVQKKSFAKCPSKMKKRFFQNKLLKNVPLDTQHAVLTTVRNCWHKNLGKDQSTSENKTEDSSQQN